MIPAEPLRRFMLAGCPEENEPIFPDQDGDGLTEVIPGKGSWRLVRRLHGICPGGRPVCECILTWVWVWRGNL